MKKIRFLRTSILLLATISLVLIGCQDDEDVIDIQEKRCSC